ncbi:MAG: hypothetical protein JW888_08430 [Pirellulales bacterium]|nr:hypothetical protein [Pirellulales bacterium]
MTGDSSIRPTRGYLDPVTWQASSKARKAATSAFPPDATSLAHEADSVDISGAGELLASLTKDLFWGVEPRADGAIHVEDIQKAYEGALSQFKGRLADLMRTEDIDRSGEAVLQTDATGQIRVVGDHPDKAQIEALFAEHPELGNEFRHLAATAGLLGAVEEAKPFLAAYAKDPEAAVQRWAQLFSNERQSHFKLRVTADAMDAIVSTG